MMNKRICMLAYTIYSRDSRVRREAEALASFPEFDVTFYTLKEGDIPRAYEMDGVHVVELDIGKYQGKNIASYLFSYFRFMLKMFVICSKLFFIRNVDVYHVHNMPNLLVFAAAIPRLFGKKIVLDIHDSMPETFIAKFENSSQLLNWLFYWEESICCRIAQKIICVNHVQMDTLIKRGISREKLEISLNVPDHRIFIAKGIRKNIENANEKFKLVYHGTLAKRLGIDLAIEAVASLVDEIPGIEFTIIGSGDDKDEFVQLTKRLKAEDHIVFSHNSFPTTELPTILEDKNLGIIANRKNKATELMLPVKMLEYIALEIPVIAPRLKCIEHYFTDGMVTFFNPESVNSMADAILNLYNDPELRARQVISAKSFLDKFGWETHQMDLITLYRSL